MQCLPITLLLLLLLMLVVLLLSLIPLECVGSRLTLYGRVDGVTTSIRHVHTMW
jgi:hypothetical protein